MNRLDKSDYESAKTIVLAVDDELALTRSIKICLEDGDKRLRVDRASSGNEAIDMIKGGNIPDAILSDLNMPNGTGEELYKWLEEHRPELVSRIIFMTACSGLLKGFAERMAQQGRLLDKPFDINVMRGKIEAVLAGRMDLE